MEEEEVITIESKDIYDDANEENEKVDKYNDNQVDIG